MVNLAARGDAQYVDEAGFVVPLKNDPHVADAQTETGTASQRRHIEVWAIRIFGQLIQFPADALGVLTGHFLQPFNGLLFYRQFVPSLFHTEMKQKACAK